MPETQLHISAVSIYELQAGVEITRGQDHARAREIDAWIDSVLGNCTVLPVDDRIFRLLAELLHRQSLHLFEDGLIAATALVHSLTVVTRNTRDFAPFKVTTFNPFRPG